MSALAQSGRRITYSIFKIYAMRRALCAVRAKWILLVLSILIAEAGCAQLRPRLTHEDLVERLHYGPDKSLEELVDIAMARGYRAVNGDGHLRQVLELSESESGYIHRQFFEVQPRSAGLSDVFFLENTGSVEQTNFSRFPSDLRKAIRKFLEGLSEGKSQQYKPMLVRQQKLSRKMVVYETSDKNRTMDFTQKVASLEKSNMYGLFLLPEGPFIFFGKESPELFRGDYLEADDRYNLMVQEFLRALRSSSAL